MKLIIDSQPVELPHSQARTFNDYCREVMQWLLSRNRAIASFCLDGQPITTVEEAEAQFPTAATCEIESVPLQVALKGAITSQLQEIDRILGLVEALVTDSLLAEPAQIAAQWQELCEATKGIIRQLPQLAGLMSDDEIEDLATTKLSEFNTTMRDIAQMLNKADVVGFSDILELRLLPWLQQFRALTQTQLESIDGKLAS